MAGASNPREAQGTEASMAELVKQLSEQTGRLARQEVEQATPPVPEQTTESVKEDVQWARTRAQAAR